MGKTTYEVVMDSKPVSNTVDTKIELLKYVSEVQCRLWKDITPDFIFAYLNDKDKEALSEITVSAFMAKELISKLKNHKRWIYSETDRKYIKKGLDINEKTIIDDFSNLSWDAYMIRLNMVAILNRNKPKNPMLSFMAGLKEDEDTEKENKEKESKSLMSFLKRFDKKVET